MGGRGGSRFRRSSPNQSVGRFLTGGVEQSVQVFGPGLSGRGW